MLVNHYALGVLVGLGYCATRKLSEVVTVQVKRYLSLFTLVCFISLQVGCYNVHNVSLDEFGHAQNPDEQGLAKMKTEKGEEIIVSENSRIGVVTNDGDYTAIAPFNFTLTSSKLIAPDQDLLLERADVKTAQVKEVSTGKTTAVVSTALAVLVGGLLFITLSAEEEKGFGE